MIRPALMPDGQRKRTARSGPVGPGIGGCRGPYRAPATLCFSMSCFHRGIIYIFSKIYHIHRQNQKRRAVCSSVWMHKKFCIPFNFLLSPCVRCPVGSNFPYFCASFYPSVSFNQCNAHAFSQYNYKKPSFRFPERRAAWIPKPRSRDYFPLIWRSCC